MRVGYAHPPAVAQLISLITLSLRSLDRLAYDQNSKCIWSVAAMEVLAYSGSSLAGEHCGRLLANGILSALSFSGDKRFVASNGNEMFTREVGRFSAQHRVGAS